MNSKSAGYNTLTLPAGDSIEVPAHAEFLRCLEANGSFEFNIEDGGWQYMAAGISYISDSPQGFETFRVRNNSASAITIVIAYGWGELRDDRLSLVGDVLPVEFSGTQPVAVQGTATVAFPSTQPVAVQSHPAVAFDGTQPVHQSDPWTWRIAAAALAESYSDIAVAAGASGNPFAARGTRRRAVVVNRGTETVYIRQDNIVIAQGIELPPGEEKSIYGTAPIYIANTSAVDVLIGRYEEYT